MTERLASAAASASAAAGRFRFVLAGFTRLHVRPTATKLAKDTGLLNLLLERLECPFETIRLGQNDFWHVRELR